MDEIGWLVLIASPDNQLLGKRFALARELRIGRDPSCDIAFDTPELFPHHASVKRFGTSAIEIEAAHPNAEVYVDDRATKSSVLETGMKVAVGPLWFRVIAGERAEALYHEEIYRMTITDSLTGLNNLRYFQEALEREILRARRYERPLVVSWFRVKGLDAVDRAGSAEGNRRLRDVAKQLASLSPNTFIVARVGGDEFGVVMPEVDPAIAQARAAHFAEQVALVVPGITLLWATTALEPGDSDGSAVLSRVRLR